MAGWFKRAEAQSFSQGLGVTVNVAIQKRLGIRRIRRTKFTIERVLLELTGERSAEDRRQHRRGFTATAG